MKKAAALGLSLALTASMTLPALAVEAMPISAKAGYDTAITLNDGKTSGQTAGGYAKGEAAKDINFMVIHPSAVLQYSKHTVNKVFAPEENQNADGWKFVFRSYGLAEVYENKVSGIYLHNKA